MKGKNTKQKRKTPNRFLAVAALFEFFLFSFFSKFKTREMWLYGHGDLFGRKTHDYGPIPRHIVKKSKLIFDCDRQTKMYMNGQSGRGWEFTSHKHQFFAFADKEYVCDCMCGKPIEKGQLMSVGTREVEGDQEIENDQYPLEGIDRIHFGCRICMQEEGSGYFQHMHGPFCHCEEEQEKTFPKLLQGKNVCTFPGFAHASEEDIRKYYLMTGKTAEDYDNDDLKPIYAKCDGVHAVITMNPDSWKCRSLKTDILKNGGVVQKDVNNATTHLIYGEKFKYYSTIYGKGSKKYAAAKRRGEDIMVWTVGEWDEKMKEDGRVVTEEWLQEREQRREEEAKRKEEEKAEKAAKRAAEKEAKKNAPPVTMERPRRSTTAPAPSPPIATSLRKRKRGAEKDEEEKREKEERKDGFMECTVAELRKECKKRGISDTGRKAELVKRLEEAEGNGGEGGKEKGEEEDYGTWTVVELKKECKRRGISDKGRKAELVKRLGEGEGGKEEEEEEEEEEKKVEEEEGEEDYGAWTVVELRKECKRRGMSDKGRKAELVKRLEEKDVDATNGEEEEGEEGEGEGEEVDYESWTVGALRKECKKRGISDKGKKSQLIKALRSQKENENSQDLESFCFGSPVTKKQRIDEGEEEREQVTTFGPAPTEEKQTDADGRCSIVVANISNGKSYYFKHFPDEPVAAIIYGIQNQTGIPPHYQKLICLGKEIYDPNVTIEQAVGKDGGKLFLTFPLRGGYDIQGYVSGLAGSNIKGSE